MHGALARFSVVPCGVLNPSWYACMLAVGGPRNGPGTGADPFANLRSLPTATVDPMEIQRLWQEQQLRARQMVLQQQSVSAKSAASKTQREVRAWRGGDCLCPISGCSTCRPHIRSPASLFLQVHVGNLIPGAIGDVMLQQIFNTALGVRFPGSNVPGMEPVIKVNVHKDGRYAFVEMRTPEMATAAMDLNGQVWGVGEDGRSVSGEECKGCQGGVVERWPTGRIRIGTYRLR